MDELIVKIENYIRENLSNELFEHSLGTRDYALEINIRHNLGLSERKIIIASLLHDVAKEYSDKKLFDMVGSAGIVFNFLELETPVLLHGQVGAYIARKTFGAEDEDILNAIRAHTTGNASMSDLDILIFVADKLERNRNYEGLDSLRRDVEENFIYGALKVMEHHKQWILTKGFKLHPDTEAAISSLKKRIDGSAKSKSEKNGKNDKTIEPSRRMEFVRSILTMDGFIIVCALISLFVAFLGSSVIGLCYMYNLIGISENNPEGDGIWSNLNRPPSYYFQKRKELLFLVGGIDGIHGTERTDTLMLVKVDFENNKVRILSIPRDTLVKIPYKHPMWERINVAFPLGRKELLLNTVKNITGFYPDYLIIVNFDGFRRIVDIVGGIEIDVDKDMNYDDHAGKLHIHLKKGPQLLNGEQALGYVRFRHDPDGDFSRVRRQQNFFNAFKERLMSPGTALKTNEIIKAIKDNIDVTAIYPYEESANIYENGLTFRQYMVLAKVLKNTPREDISSNTLKMMNDGIDYHGMSVQLLDYKAFDQTMLDFFAP